MREGRSPRLRMILGMLATALLAVSAITGAPFAVAAPQAGTAASPRTAVRPGSVGQPVRHITPPRFPQRFAAPARAARLPKGEASACPVPSWPGQVQCMALSRTGLQPRTGLQAAAATVSGYSPASLQSAYNLGTASASGGMVNGLPETIAVVDAYDDPNAAADLATYRAQWGLPACDASTGAGCVTKVNEDNQASPLPAAPPASAGDWTWEESADLDMVSAICPSCRILLFEASSATVADLGQAELSAELDADFITNSWGSPEFFGETDDDVLYLTAPGKAIVFAAGDAGYGTAWPAASQYVTAVGGTTLTPDSSSTRGWTEAAWSGTGSGCATAEAKPSWQTADDTSPAGCLNRTENDVAAVADPATGVAAYDSTSYSGSAARSAGWGVAGGTSVAAAIITSVYALNGYPQAGTNPASYPYQSGSAAGLYPVTSGSNGSCEANRAYLCAATAGYNGPAGVGSPDGTADFAFNVASDVITIPNPGTQDLEAGKTISLQVQGTDSSPGAAVTYSATGLPSGVTINSATGVISGTVHAGISDVTVTASGSEGGSGSVTFTVVVVVSLRTNYYPMNGAVPLNFDGKCLDDKQGGTANGTAVQEYACDQDPASQDWTYQPDGYPGAAGTLTLTTDQSKCVDISGSGTANGTPVQLWNCISGAPSQRWKITSNGELVNPVSGRCLTDPGGSTAESVQLEITNCTGAAYQQWTNTPSAVQSGVSGYCMDDANGSITDGNRVKIYTCNGVHTSQNWVIEPDGTIQIQGHCLDLTSNATTGNGMLDGAPVQLWTCNGQDNQQWVIGPLGQIENVHSGRCLDDPGDSTTDNTQLVQEDCYGQPGEIWAAT